MKRFSIVIPNYNKGELVKKCLDSVFNQKFNKDDYEVIVVDDGSTDDSINYIKEYDVILLNSKRLGAGGARNKGFDIATGEYIILLDSDDYLASEYELQNLSNSLNDEEIVFVRYIENKMGVEKIISEDESKSLNELIYSSKYFCCTLKCFKRSLIDDIRYKEKCCHEDIAFVIELMCSAKTMLFYKNNFYVYNKPNSNSTVDNYTVRKALDFLNQTLEYFYFADKYPDKKESIMKRINPNNYYKKIDHLYEWVNNDKEYSYKEYLE